MDYVIGAIASGLIILIIMMIIKLKHDVAEVEELQKRIDRFFDEDM